MSESVILCEGYHDRAFWKGWLIHLGCIDEGLGTGEDGRKPVYDPWNNKVTGGQYAYRSKGGAFVRVKPCHGKSKIIPAARVRLKERATKPLVRLVINMDTDAEPEAAARGPAAPDLGSVLALAREFDPAAADEGGIIRIGGDSPTELALVRWEVDDAAAPGLPGRQTLERLVCAAIVAAYPRRGADVQAWLDSRHEPPDGGDPKEFAWSHMAGWYARRGCEDFYSCLWDDPLIVDQLRARLGRSGAWRIAEAIAS